MGFRVEAPGGKKGKDGLPMLVLPEETVLRGKYKAKYLTVGGMCIAYKAEYEGNVYFIKEVETGDPRRMVSLSQEKLILDQLNHPGIIKVFDFFEEDGFYYLVMEFVEGQSLEKLISPMAGIFLQEKVIIEWALQLCDIFEYLHKLTPPIIYRDLKPQNIIKDTRGRLRLVDFGIARIYKINKAEDTEFMGSALTASPEHFGAKQTDERSDIYTLGATLHYLATNGKGFSGQLFEFEPPRSLNPKLSESFDRIIMKCLELDPDKRYQSIAELRAALGGPRGEKAAAEEKKTDPAPAEALKTLSAARFSLSDTLQRVKKYYLRSLYPYKSYITLALAVFLVAFTGIMLIKASAPRQPAALGTLPLASLTLLDDRGLKEPPPLAVRENPVQEGLSAQEAPSIPEPGAADPSASPGAAAPPLSSVTPSPERAAPSSSAPPATLPTAPYLPGETVPRATRKPRPMDPGNNNPQTTALSTPASQPAHTAPKSREELLGQIFKIQPSGFRRVDSVKAREINSGTADYSYEINIPRDYLNFTPKKMIYSSTEKVFAKIDPIRGESTLRYLILYSHANYHSGATGFIEWQSLDSAFRDIISKNKDIEVDSIEPQSNYIENKAGLEYSFNMRVRENFLEGTTFHCEEIIYAIRDRKSIYSLTACALPERYSYYQDEFREFFRNYPSVK
ncbi:MAG: protein kinase [Candidatus Eremiobacteraeota bacterium]|nr:protein kinase [Candidatus Eremiobacteraeota bacterium]